MRPGVRSWMLIFPSCLSLCAACTHSPPSSLPSTFAPCSMAGVGPVDSSWRQVRASGFTFCVPASWRPSGAATDSVDPTLWHGREGSVTWHLGRPESTSSMGRRADITVAVVTTGTPVLAPPYPAAPSASTGDAESCAQPANTPYVVDSVTVVVTQTACRGTWMTTAWSTTPAMYVQGQTHAVENTKVLNAIMVTIRFASTKH